MNAKNSIKNSFLNRTNQVWKWNIFKIIILLFVVHIVFCEFVFIKNSFLNIILSLTIFSCAIGWIILAVRCPKCNRHPGKHIFFKSPFYVWYIALRNFAVCPYCGFQGEENGETDSQE